jgi:hypothetical protein
MHVYAKRLAVVKAVLHALQSFLPDSCPTLLVVLALLSLCSV